MDDFLDVLAGELQRLGIGTEGVDLFTNKMPKVANQITLLGLPGTNLTAARDVAGLQFPRFQAFIRNEDYDTGSTNLQAVRTALHNKIGINLPYGVNTATTPYVRLKRCHVEQEGGPIGEDELGRAEFSINFIAEFHYVDPT